WVTNQTSCTANEHDRMMACRLKMAQHQNLDEVANVNGSGRRVEAAIIADRFSVKCVPQLFPIGRLRDKSSPFEFIEDRVETRLFEILHLSHCQLPVYLCFWPYLSLSDMPDRNALS